jgi:hypothetical protein
LPRKTFVLVGRPQLFQVQPPEYEKTARTSRCCGGPDRLALTFGPIVPAFDGSQTIRPKDDARAIASFGFIAQLHG